MRTYFPPCYKRFIATLSEAGFSLNVIPLQYGSNPLYFPRPFQIVGLMNLSELNDGVPGGPTWPLSLQQFASPADQNTYSQLSPSLQLELAIASTEKQIEDPFAEFPFGPFQYNGPGVQNTNYRGQLSKYLNEKITIDEPRQWFNSLLNPTNRFRQYAVDNALTAQAAWTNGYLQLLENICKVSDLRLWGAPGEYGILSFVGMVSWLPVSEYEMVVGG